MTRRLLLALVLVPLFATSAHAKPVAAPPPAPELPPLDEAIASARQAGKPLVVDFYTDWCKPCQQFEDTILPDARVQAALAQVVFMRYDAEKGQGLPAAARYRVDAYPTFVVIDGQGKLVGRSSGMNDDPTVFVDFIERGVALALDEATVKQRVDDKQADARALLGAARWLSAHRRVDEAISAYARAGKVDKAGKLGVAPVAEWESFALVHARAYRKKLAEDAAAFAERWPAAARADDAARLALASGQLVPARARKLWALRLKHAWNDAAALNQLAYAALAFGDLDTALAAAQRAVELAPQEAGKHDTLAEVFHYRGERARALAESERAIGLNVDARATLVLEDNRARFAAAGLQPSSDVEAERLGGERELAAFAGDDGMPEPVVDPPASGPPISPEVGAALVDAEKQRRDFQLAAQTAWRGVSGKCAGQAGGLAEVYVRIELATAGGAPTRVIVLEPAASAPLKKCLTEAFTGAKFPPPPVALKGRFTAPLHFAPAAARTH